MKHSLFRHLSLIAVIGALAFSSCVSQKKVLLLKEIQMADQNKSVEYQNERNLNYKIQPGDNLYIKAINIIDERNSNVLNGEGGRNYMNSDASIYLNSYTVNENGFLDYPLTGLVQVKNLTVEQAKDRLQNGRKSARQKSRQPPTHIKRKLTKSRRKTLPKGLSRT